MSRSEKIILIFILSLFLSITYAVLKTASDTREIVDRVQVERF